MGKHPFDCLFCDTYILRKWEQLTFSLNDYYVLEAVLTTLYVLLQLSFATIVLKVLLNTQYKDIQMSKRWIGD